MEISPSFEKWSWIAGIVSAAIALVALIWQIVFTERSSSRKTDWNVMDKAFQGIRIGAAIQSMYKLGQHVVAPQSLAVDRRKGTWGSLVPLLLGGY